MFFDLEQEEKPVIKLERVYPNRRKRIEAIEKELYRRCMDDELNTDEMLEVLQVLADNQNQDDSLAVKENISTTGFFNQLINTGFFMLLLATAVSLIAYKPCENSQSPFCKSAKIIPEFVQNMFREPPKSKVLPLNLP